ncbi:MAG TPA: hypothetical protein V6D06_20035 [Trichocoleus sp.]
MESNRPVLARVLVLVFMILGVGLVLGMISFVTHLDSNDLISALSGAFTTA